MKNPLRHCLALVAIAWALPTIIWSAPAEINYQGRLTDGNGDAVTGNVLMSLKLFDAATAGNEIYSENIGTVTLDNNGVYSFQFGAEGQSEVDARTTIALADGVTTSYSGSLASTPLSGTLAVADGTYNWNIVDGNPGQQATAAAQLANGFVIGITVTDGGEGYTAEPVVTINGNGTGATATAVVENGVLTAINVDSAGSGYTNATVSIAAPPAPFVVDFVSGTVSVNYESAPAAGTEIVATYEVNESSIVGALSAASSHWLELSIDGTAQSPRERVLSVPFALLASAAAAATGDLGDDIFALKYPDGVREATQRGTYIEGQAAIDVAAGYRMKILARGNTNRNLTSSDENDIFVAGLGAIDLTQTTPIYIDGPATVDANYGEPNPLNKTWFSYEIAPRTERVFRVGTYIEGQAAIEVTAGYRMKILARGNTNRNKTSRDENDIFVAGLGAIHLTQSTPIYIDGPATVDANYKDTHPLCKMWFSYEIISFESDN